MQSLAEGRSFVRAIISLAVGAIIALATLLLSPFSTSIFESIFFAAVLAVGVISAAIISYRLLSESEHEKVKQTDQIISITSQTLQHLRQGLNEESASKVAQIIVNYSGASVVAITDKSKVLACEGAGRSQRACGPIITSLTQEAMDKDTTRIMQNSSEIGCSSKECHLKCGIITPLYFKGNVAGSLKFYYKTNDKISVSNVAFAKGLATLLSTQLELSEIEHQTSLAYQAQLKALQAQINPHFLFNTLNTIAMFCRTKPAEARRLLLEFSAFFRKSLERSDDYVTLREEMAYVNQYLLFEKARFGENINIEQNIDDGALEIRVPALTIQPLVENAIRHGFPTASQPLRVSVNISLDEDLVSIIIKDNGSGIKKEDLDSILVPGFGKGTGLGLSNVNDRLRGIFGEDYKISISSLPGKGTSVMLHLPSTISFMPNSNINKSKSVRMGNAN